MEFFYFENGQIRRGQRTAHDQDDIEMIIDELDDEYGDEWFETYEEAREYGIINDLIF